MKVLFSVFVCLFFSSSALFAQWTQTSFSAVPPVQITDVAVIDNYLFVSTSEGNIYRSNDLGNSWSLVNNGLSATNISVLYGEKNGNSSTFYAATDSGLFISNDLGDNWTSLSNGISDKRLTAFYKTENYLFASSIYDSKEYRSTNSGNDWEEISIGDAGQRVNSFVRYNNTIFAGLSFSGNHFVFKSDDFGLTWSPSDNGMQSEVDVIEKSGTRLFAGYSSSNVYQSTDAGNNWITLTGIPAGYPVTDMKSIGNYLFIASFIGLYTIYDSENSLIDITDNLPNPCGVVKVDINEQYILAWVFDLINGENTIWFRPTPEITDVKDNGKILPKFFSLNQNYPNPFNPLTIINYQLRINNFVSLKVFDVLGNEVSTLVNEEKSAGSYSVKFDGMNLSSGIYFYKLTAGSFVETKKMVLLK